MNENINDYISKPSPIFLIIIDVLTIFIMIYLMYTIYNNLCKSSNQTSKELYIYKSKENLTSILTDDDLKVILQARETKARETKARETKARETKAKEMKDREIKTRNNSIELKSRDVKDKNNFSEIKSGEMKSRVVKSRVVKSKNNTSDMKSSDMKYRASNVKTTVLIDNVKYNINLIKIADESGDEIKESTDNDNTDNDTTDNDNEECTDD